MASGKNKLDIRFDLPTDEEIKRLFNAIPKLEHHQVTQKAVRAGAIPIVRRARQLTPRASAEDRRKRSNSQKREANWDIPLHTTIAHVVRHPRKGASYAVVGPKWQDGQKAYFNTGPSGRVRKLWGHDPTQKSGLSSVAPQVENWIVQAFDETKNQQIAAMGAKLHKLMDAMWKRWRDG